MGVESLIGESVMVSDRQVEGETGFNGKREQGHIARSRGQAFCRGSRKHDRGPSGAFGKIHHGFREPDPVSGTGKGSPLGLLLKTLIASSFSLLG